MSWRATFVLLTRLLFVSDRSQRAFRHARRRQPRSDEPRCHAILSSVNALSPPRALRLGACSSVETTGLSRFPIRLFLTRGSVLRKVVLLHIESWSSESSPVRT